MWTDEKLTMLELWTADYIVNEVWLADLINWQKQSQCTCDYCSNRVRTSVSIKHNWTYDYLSSTNPTMTIQLSSQLTRPCNTKTNFSHWLFCQLEYFRRYFCCLLFRVAQGPFCPKPRHSTTGQGRWSQDDHSMAPQDLSLHYLSLGKMVLLCWDKKLVGTAKSGPR